MRIFLGLILLVAVLFSMGCTPKWGYRDGFGGGVHYDVAPFWHPPVKVEDLRYAYPSTG